MIFPDNFEGNPEILGLRQDREKTAHKLRKLSRGSEQFEKLALKQLKMAKETNWQIFTEMASRNVSTFMAKCQGLMRLTRQGTAPAVT
jgi:hypothetical protein